MSGDGEGHHFLITEHDGLAFDNGSLASDSYAVVFGAWSRALQLKNPKG